MISRRLYSKSSPAFAESFVASKNVQIVAENDGKWQDFISFLVKMADTPFLKGESPQALFQIFQVAGIGISKDNFRKGWVDYVDHDGSHGWVVWKKPAAQHDRCRQFVFPSVPSCSTQWDEDEKKRAEFLGW